MSSAHALAKFFKTPKGLLTIILGALATVGAAQAGFALALPGLLSAIVAAAVLDVLLLRVRHSRWEFPSGAILTGMFVGMILSPFQPWRIAAATSLLAIVTKHAFRTKSANMFNPAAMALIASFYLFNTAQSWWGALPELPMIAVSAVFISGIFIANRMNKMPMVLTFLGVYYLLFTVTAYVGDPRRVVEVFRAPDLQAALFFAFFMLTDPPTAPIKYRDQVTYGALVALGGYVLFETAGVVFYLLGGLMIGNAWETWRRLKVSAARRQTAAAGSELFRDRRCVRGRATKP